MSQFQRIISTRRRIARNGTYFGPYASVKGYEAMFGIISKTLH